MGNNTIFFGLNDMADSYEKSPHAFAFMLANAYGFTSSRKDDYRQAMLQVAKKHDEPFPQFQALEAIVCFHASESRYYVAGGNCMRELRVLRSGKTKDGKRTITLQVDD